MENADLDETLPYAHGAPSPNMNSDLDQPYLIQKDNLVLIILRPLS